MSSKKWTRAEVMRAVEDLENNYGASHAAAMLRDLAPPAAPRQWTVGELLRWEGRNCWVRVVEKSGDVMLSEITAGWSGWAFAADLANATPLKLVAHE